MLQISNQRKRLKRSLNEDIEPRPKKSKLCSPTHSTSPANYLDSLSKIWLTREAVTELNRRTKQVRSNHEHRPAGRRPLTRSFRAHLRDKLCSTRTPASYFVQHCTPETLEEIKLYARHGGPNLWDLRGYPEPAYPSRYSMSSTQSDRRQKRGKRGKRGSESSSRIQRTSTSSATTRVTKSSGSYNPNFHQRLIDSGIYPYGYEYPDGRVPPEPDNFDEIQHMLMDRRPSLSPSVFPEEKFKEFRRTDAQVTSENKATQKIIPMIQGTIKDERCVDGPDIRLANLANLLNGADHKAKPDVWYGARPEQVDRRIRDNEELGTYVVPSTTDSRPCAPNFFVETKGPRGSNAVGLDQACFDGALGARGIYKLQTYGQDVPTCDNNAYALSTTYHAGVLKMYAHHMTQPDGPGTEPESYMNQLRAWAMTDGRDTLLKGMAAFRNGVSWAETQRNAAIEHANAVANDIEDDEIGNFNDYEDDENEFTGGPPNPVRSSFTSQNPFSGQSILRSEATRQESDTSPDELALEVAPSRYSTRRKRPKIKAT